MSIQKYLETQPLHDLTKYVSHVDLDKEAVPFVATPRKHPYDDDKILLIQDPFSANTSFYEFRTQDVLHVEDMPNIGTESGRNVKMVKVWIKKGSLGMRYEPFEVDDPPKFYKDSEILKQAVAKG